MFVMRSFILLFILDQTLNNQTVENIEELKEQFFDKLSEILDKGKKTMTPEEFKKVIDGMRKIIATKPADKKTLKKQFNFNFKPVIKPWTFPTLGSFVPQSWSKPIDTSFLNNLFTNYQYYPSSSNPKRG